MDWQVPPFLARENTTFSTASHHRQYRVMSSGLPGSPATSTSYGGCPLNPPNLRSSLRGPRQDPRRVQGGTPLKTLGKVSETREWIVLMCVCSVLVISVAP
ncbi:hypothetical protein DPEC_G00323940 [Dallia pectoralis]|uniref:Uncharacterized protein n=1 Tax=Dallia pectoralis TaxID=75939 RepID=A0ACC2FAX1_DALPE|nr:hypothetical protein DPEC_G00323940 [Dallia pectoralis]